MFTPRSRRPKTSKTAHRRSRVSRGRLETLEQRVVLDAYGLEVLADAPVAYYPLNEGSGATAIDASGNGFDGAIEGASYVGHSRAGTALDFGTAGDIVRVVNKATGLNPDALDSLAANNSATIEFWTYDEARTNNFAFSNAAGTDRFGGHAPWSDNVVYFDTGGCCEATQRLSYNSGLNSLANWNHWVFIKDGDTKSIYRNNQLQITSATQTAPIGTDTTFDVFNFGSFQTGANTINAIIDDFAIYDTALSPERISAHYHASSNLVADGSYPVVQDATLATTDTDASTLSNTDDGLLLNDPFPLVNVARLGTASQSSTRTAGGSAQRAIDGNTSGNFGVNSTTHTNGTAADWWQVDLGASYPVEKIVVTGRTDCCLDRLDMFRVSVYDGDPTAGGTEVFGQDFTAQVPAGDPLEITIAPPGTPATGNFVRVQLNEVNVLSLAEVQVFANALEVESVQGTALAGAAATVATDGGGEVTVNPDGTFTYDQLDTFDGLPTGATAVDTFTYQRTALLTDNGTYLGTGAAALLGGDLTDPENDGAPDADTGYNATFDANNEPGFGGGEFSFNIFDNQVGGGTAKWCCDSPGAADGTGFFVSAAFAQPYILTHFTITSSNDSPARDPDVWAIEGSNDGTTWAPIYSYNHDGASPWRAAQAGQTTDTTRNQVLLYSSPNGPLNLTGNVANFPTPTTAYSQFRYFVDSAEGNGANALNEIELFGVSSITPPTASITVTGVNDAPVAVADTAATGENTVVTVDVLANDTDADTDDNPANFTLTNVSINGVSDPASAGVGSGAVSIVGNQLQFDPGADFDVLADGETAVVTVDYTMEDNEGLASMAQVTLTVTGENDLGTADAGGPYTIAEGDGLQLMASTTDPDTNDTLAFSWDINGDGTFGDATGASPMLSFSQLQALMPTIDDGPATFDVTVRVNDGTADVDSASTLLTLENAAPSATISGPDSAVPGFEVAFDIGASDPSNADQAGEFTYTIQWNDGSPEQTVVGTAAETVMHSFNNIGDIEIEITVTDKDGEESAVETFEIEVVPVAIIGDDLYAGGTGNSDTIIFSPAGAGIQVRYNNTTYPTDGSSFSVGSDGSMLAFGQGGSDRIIVAGGLQVPAIFDGGEGNDYLAGGDANDILLGDAGNDILLGGEGDNLLIGDDREGAATAGSDRMEGRDGADTLFGGGANDRLNGGGGDDILDGGNDNDFLFGGIGNDLLVGGQGADNLNGSRGNDVVLGGSQSDQIFGGNDHDLLFGGTAADRLRGDGGDDDLIGGTSALEDDNSIQDALDAMLASMVRLDLAAAGPTGAAVDAAVSAWQSSGNDASGFGAFDDSDAVDDLTGGAGVDGFHSSSDDIRDFRSDDTMI